MCRRKKSGYRESNPAIRFGRPVHYHYATAANFLNPNNLVSCLERLRGIEPRSPAWEAGALPLCYSRIPDAFVRKGRNDTIDSCRNASARCDGAQPRQHAPGVAAPAGCICTETRRGALPRPPRPTGRSPVRRGGHREAEHHQQRGVPGDSKEGVANPETALHTPAR